MKQRKFLLLSQNYIIMILQTTAEKYSNILFRGNIFLQLRTLCLEQHDEINDIRVVRRNITAIPIKYTVKLSSTYPSSILVRGSWSIRPFYLVTAGEKKRVRQLLYYLLLHKRSHMRRRCISSRTESFISICKKMEREIFFAIIFFGKNFFFLISLAQILSQIRDLNIVYLIFYYIFFSFFILYYFLDIYIIYETEY